MTAAHRRPQPPTKGLARGRGAARASRSRRAALSLSARSPALLLQRSSRTSSLPLPRYTVTARKKKKGAGGSLSSSLGLGILLLRFFSDLVRRDSIKDPTSLSPALFQICSRPKRVSFRGNEGKINPARMLFIHKNLWGRLSGTADELRSRSLLRVTLNTTHLGTPRSPLHLASGPSAAARPTAPLPPPAKPRQEGCTWGKPPRFVSTVSATPSLPGLRTVS